ncbi:rod shape-determining protein MreC [Rhodocytophaga aerolata]|uniref:Cell shape-determining protein MreC n=1 Tax=Rhodocytophaga aerolata TaxID=455078 RepID=A0ABT8R8X2_9BACT|nr:rod shape-determining protein MreC [Rhodocytophaga aerolata]MDO1448535.1 rod shape-determining protein MreC [Rhodocytophaga aerolata]
MQRLFLFFYQYRAFIFFILIELLCAWLIVKNNRYQNAAFLNSTNRYAAQMMAATNTVIEFVNLRKVNADLAHENAKLNNLNARLVQQGDSAIPKGYWLDSLVAQRYRFKVAKVINNSTSRTNNYLTLDKGTLDGIKPGMGVVSPEGVVGKIKYCSDHFSNVVSLLHTEMQVSSQIKKNGTFGTARWIGKNAKEIDLLYIPRHVELQKGDTVVTTSYNTIFPEGVMVGTVKNFSLKGDDAFYDINLDLSIDFYRLSYVYIVENLLQTEQDSLERRTLTGLNE